MLSMFHLDKLKCDRGNQKVNIMITAPNQKACKYATHRKGSYFVTKQLLCISILKFKMGPTEWNQNGFIWTMYFFGVSVITENH